MQKRLRPIDLARAVGISTQAVRNYEQWGFLPPAERGPQGYRLYSQQHLHAIRTARALIGGFGWEHALHIMQRIHQDDLPSAFAVIDARHATIHRSRLEAEETLRALRTISEALPSSTEIRGKKKLLQIGEVAKRLGVRVSTVRFWEDQGLVEPVRGKDNRYRLYDEQQVRLLQVVALLRKTGYNIKATRAVLIQLATGTPEQALLAAENRLKELGEASRRCVEATAALWEYYLGTRRTLVWQT